MNSDKRLWAMEEELAANWIKTDKIELALKAIINNLEVPSLEESVMEKEFNFGHNSRVPVNSETHTLSHVKIKPATPADFDGHCEKG